MDGTRCFEDFAVGQRFTSPPQPVPCEALFDGLSSSGWHAAAMTMALALQSDLRPASGFVGLGVDELRWPRPVRPDDLLCLEARVESLRPLRARADTGVMRLRMTTRNQDGEVVFDCLGTVLVPRRAPAHRRMAPRRSPWALMA